MGGLGMAQVVDHLPCKCNTLSSNTNSPLSPQNENKVKEKEKFASP
jgi:hypothetical protein